MLTHTPPQESIPTAHMPPLPASDIMVIDWQTPLAHIIPTGHVLPQPPQWPGSDVMLTQRSPQRICPAGQATSTPPSVGPGVTHMPLPQTVPTGHELPQAPQLPMLPRVSTHTAPHCTSPVGQVTSTPASMPAAQAPATQARPLGQARPQPPQWAVLTAVLTQKPSQRVRPMPQAMPPSIGGGAPTQAPATQLWPAAQARPQPPQWASLVRKSTHAPPHSICPAGQRGGASGGGGMSSGTIIPSGSIIMLPSIGTIIPSGSIIMLPSIGTIIPSGSIIIASGGTAPSGGGAAQAPITQACPTGQARPQPPQCAVLIDGSTHAPPHSTCPAGQAFGRLSEGTSRAVLLVGGVDCVQAARSDARSPKRRRRDMAVESTRVSQRLTTR
jgi:hypothetical protein